MELLPPYNPDTLPTYDCTITLQGRLLCRQECETPDIQAWGRHWRRLEAELRGTTLLLFEFRTSKGPAQYWRSYTLQGGDTGLATDYRPRGDVFRARVEGEQLLLAAPGVEAAAAWVESLLAATVISDPLENRKMPRYPKMPSRRSKPLQGTLEADGFGRRLWAELAWRNRHRRDWLLEVSSKSRKDRWRDVVRGHEAEKVSTFFETRSESESGSSDRSNSRCRQCPCSDCWRSKSRREFVEAVEEERVTTSADQTNSDECHEALEQSVRSPRVLTKWSAWQNGYYIRNGRRVKITPRPALDDSQSSAWL